ncbi:MAG: SUMF1/EgtB/PvdO family nonheme iron enzyme [Anaerolineae bacterium]|nr:SUMF1/EgtB/PvdO family nonheme iron enzyme [Anaerolineae bacterium]
MVTEPAENRTSDRENGRSFYGRQDVFMWIQERLAQKSPTQPIVLYGPPRIGKTAVLHQISDGRLGHDIVPVYINFENLLHESLSIFLSDMAATAVTTLNAAGYNLAQPTNADFVVAPYKAFSTQFLLPALEKLGQKKLLLLCDNLNLLLDAEKEGSFEPQTFEAFYRLIHAQPRAYTLFTLNQPLNDANTDPLLTIGSIPHFQIQNLSKDETIDMVQQQQEFTIFRDAAQFVYQLTDGQPADTQTYCQAIHKRQETLGLHHITVADITAVHQQINARQKNTAPNTIPAASFYIRREAPRERTDYRLPGQQKSARLPIFALIGLVIVALIIAVIIFRDPIQQQIAGEQPPAISETAVMLTSEAMAAAMLASTPSPTATAVPTETSTPEPSHTPTITPTPEPSETPTIAPSPTSDTPPESYIRQEDGMNMNYIPGGTFMMGSLDEDFTAAPDERPQHEVEIDPFYLDQFEVTVAQYAAFINRIGTYKEACYENDCVHPRFEAGFTSYLLEEDQGDGSFIYIPLTGFSDYPINHVSWYGAQAYCEAIGARLPTEAEWEYAARGDDGRTYPWGNTPPDEEKAVFASSSYDNLKPVDALPDGQSPFGIYAMAGSLWEWTNDWYEEDYYSISPRNNPTGPETSLNKVIRGGAWPDNNLADRIRSANRSNFTPDFISATVGFRCARNP